MPTTSFNRRATPAAAEPASKEVDVTENYDSPKDVPVAGEAPSRELPATVAPATLSTSVAAAADSDVQGDVNLSDLRLPRLNLVQRTGDLPDKFGFGEFVLNKTCLIPRPLEFIALSIKKQFQEKRPYGDTERGAVYDSAEEVRAAGGTIGFGDYQFSELAHIFMLIKKDASLDTMEDAEAVRDLFMYELAGGQWAPVIYSVGRSAYTSLGKALLTARQFTLRKGLYTGRWSMTSSVNKGSKGTWVTPVPTFRGRLSDADAEIANSIRRGE
jgi:hypothetical protein